MPLVNPFGKPTDRLKRAINEASRDRPDRERAANDLRTALDRDVAAVVAAGSTDLAVEAWRTLTNLYAQINQMDKAIQVLGEMRGYPFAAPTVPDIVLDLKLANPSTVSEQHLLKLASWATEDGRLSELIPTLVTALEDRFPRSVPLATVLGDAYVTAGDYASASVYYHKAEGLTPSSDKSQYLPKLQALVLAAPRDQLAQSTLGLLYFRQRNCVAAAEHLALADGLGYLDTDPLFALADAYLEIQHWEKAVSVLERLLDRPETPVEIARRCERIQAAGISGNSVPTLRTQQLWGDALRLQERHEEALDHYRQVLDNLPSDERGQKYATGLLERLASVAQGIAPSGLADCHIELGRAYLLAGQPQRAFDSYVFAVNTDYDAVPAAMAGTQRIIATQPSMLAARLQLADWQIDTAEWRAAQDSLAAIRHDLPQDHATTINRYERLLARLEEDCADEQLRSSPVGPILIAVLFALAEEYAADTPGKATACLARILAVQGSIQANAVLYHLTQQQLIERQPVTARLVQGDAYLAKHDYPAALAAYQAAPVDRDTVDTLCAHLDALAQVDTRNPEALLTSAKARFDTGAFVMAAALYRQAFRRNKEQATSVIVTQFGSLLDDEGCPVEAMDLLADALIHRGDGPSLNRSLDVIQRMWQVDSNRVDEAAAKSQLIYQQVPAGSKVSARSILLLGEIWAIAGRPEDAVVILAAGIGQPHVDQQKLIELLEGLTHRSPHLPAAWLALGDALATQKKRSVPDSLAAYARALDIDPEKTAHDILDRINRQNYGGRNLARARLLKAEALARTDAHSQALTELQHVLGMHDQQILSDIERVTTWLPSTGSTWLLRAQIEAARRDPVAASAWLNRVIDGGQRSEWSQAEKILRVLYEQFANDATCRLALARALWRMELMAAAVGVLTEVVTAFPDARPEAMTMLNEMTQKVPIADMWLAQARGFIAENDIPAALNSLSHTMDDSLAWPAAYEYLLALHADHPERPDVLRALVQMDILIGQPETLARAVSHARAWLDHAPDQAQQVSVTVADILVALEASGMERESVARDAHLLCSDVLLIIQQPAMAAAQLRTVILTWPDDSHVVVDRCKQALGASDSLEMRLVLADAYLGRQQYRLALNVFDRVSDTEHWARQEIIARCKRVVEETQRESPRLAAHAARIEAEWQARHMDVRAASHACRLASSLDPSQTVAIVGWMTQHGWDDTSQRILLYEGADILRVESRPALMARSIDIYRIILDRNLLNEANSVLLALQHFPPDYWPAWQLTMDIGLRLGPSYYDQTYDAMHEVLNVFGLQQTHALLAICDQMDQAVPGVYLVRADILEAEDRLAEAADTLLGMQVSLPNEFVKVVDALHGLIERHPAAHFLWITLGDTYRNANQWDDAIAAYAAAQRADETLVPTLLMRYESALAALPDNVAIRWGLARANDTVDQPHAAARYLDELTDLDPDEDPAAEEFLKALIGRHPDCGHGWYVRGKLAYRNQQIQTAIEYFERAIREQGVLPTSSVLLHDMLGRAYHVHGALEAALHHLRCAVALAPDQRPLREAVVRVRLAMLDREIQIKTAELSAQDGDVQVYLDIASLLQRRGSHHQAIRYLQSALQLPERHGQIYLSLARNFVACHRYDLASASAQAAIRSHPIDSQQDQTELKEALYWLAWSQYRLLRYDEALETLAQLSTLDIAYLNVSTLTAAIQQDKAEAGYAPVPLRFVASLNLIPDGA